MEINKIDILTVSVSMTPDVQDFLAYGSLLSGSARLIQGETNVPITSKLGVISLCDGTPFNVQFINCSDNEIDNFRRFEYHEPSEYIDNGVILEFKLENESESEN